MVPLIDILLIIIVYAYVFAIIMMATILQNRIGLSSKDTRRIIHIFAGDAVLLLPAFSAWWYPLTLPLGLAIIVGVRLTAKDSVLRRVLVDESTYSKLHALAPLYYVISIGLLVPLSWSIKAVGMAAVMVMAWGDGSAALTLKIEKRHRYPFSDKTIEGSLIMLLFAFLGAALAWIICVSTGTTTVGVSRALSLALIGAAVGTIAEALSIGPLRPFDNFTVPLTSALAMYMLI